VYDYGVLIADVAVNKDFILDPWRVKLVSSLCSRSVRIVRWEAGLRSV